MKRSFNFIFQCIFQTSMRSLAAISYSYIIDRMIIKFIIPMNNELVVMSVILSICASILGIYNITALCQASQQYQSILLDTYTCSIAWPQKLKISHMNHCKLFCCTHLNEIFDLIFLNIEMFRIRINGLFLENEISCQLCQFNGLIKSSINA